MLAPSSGRAGSRDCAQHLNGARRRLVDKARGNSRARSWSDGRFACTDTATLRAVLCADFARSMGLTKQTRMLGGDQPAASEQRYDNQLGRGLPIGRKRHGNLQPRIVVSELHSCSVTDSDGLDEGKA